MEAIHTVIVGAGPGGLACARLLAAAGKEVVVLERSGRPGRKVCAGGITSAGLASFETPAFLERSFPAQAIHTAWQKARITASAPIISTVSRERLGQWMLARARAEGATVRTGVQVRGIAGDLVHTDAGDFRFRYLVGADGSTSLVRRHLGLPAEKVGVGIHYQVPGDFGEMEWHLDPKLFGNGYAWIFPHCRQASVGVYAGRGGMSSPQLLAGLRLWCRKQGIDLTGLRPEAALINYDYRGWRFDNRFLVGDAAGLASGLTGEGIYPAIVSGETVARVILDGNFSGADLAAIIRKQRIHHRVLEVTGKSGLLATVVMEILTMALRLGLLHFSALEMR